MKKEEFQNIKKKHTYTAETNSILCFGTYIFFMKKQQQQQQQQQ